MCARSSKQEIQREVELLRNVLFGRMRCQELTGEELQPPSQKDIAILLDWNHVRNGKKVPNVVKVSRRMQRIFGDKPQKIYICCFQSIDPPRGYKSKAGELEAIDSNCEDADEET